MEEEYVTCASCGLEVERKKAAFIDEESYCPKCAIDILQSIIEEEEEEILEEEEEEEEYFEEEEEEI